MNNLLERLAAKLGMRKRTLVVLLVLGLAFVYLQEIHDSMEGFIDGYRNGYRQDSR